MLNTMRIYRDPAPTMFLMQRAFTLVELSIVLVILGLLVGGVLAGQSLIRAAELRSVTTQYNAYVAATNSFRDKYFALPGDMTNAQSFWGVAHATPATCVTTVGTGTQTCNGDGDGRTVPSTGSNEAYRYWQHLANAGLIEGNYRGTTDGSTTFSCTRNNSPAGKIGTSVWCVWNWGTLTSNAGLYDGVYNNFYMLGTVTANDVPWGALFKPEEMWNIDTKIDDGRPAVGKLVVSGSGTCVDSVTTNNFAANYLLTGTAVGCVAIFRNAF